MSDAVHTDIHIGLLFNLELFWFFSLLHLFEVIEKQYLLSRTKVVIRVCLDLFKYVNFRKSRVRSDLQTFESVRLHAEALVWWPVWFLSLLQGPSDKLFFHSSSMYTVVA